MATNKKRNRKLRNLITVCALFAIVLSVGTYAWFIGMKTVNVSPFDIEIATTEGLFLSMDGLDWQYNLDVKNATQYEGNTNAWAEDGLIPMSSVGDADKASSRMKLYEKASLTAGPGGYRLLTSRVDNYNTPTGSDDMNQGKGYVVFDLFIKNLSGEEYYPTNQPLNEEAIYLTTNSKVGVAEAGIENTGIENSIRIAFMQVGRVIATNTTQSVITGITCDNSGSVGNEDYVTGICRNAQIWEPNDKSHVTNAINWYNEACKVRKESASGNKVNEEASYDKTSDCTTIADNDSYPTYTVTREIAINDQVDIYDGEKYNTYTNNTTDYATYSAATDKSGYKLVEFPYFTDTMKNQTGNDRPQFMTLAPNSITKVRVYIYLEGQDVDNYDFASLGKQVSINFGFTKERYTESDVGHQGPSTNITPTGSIENATGSN